MIETAPSAVVGAVTAGAVLAAISGYWLLSRRRDRESGSAELETGADAGSGSGRLPFFELADESDHRTIDPQILLPVVDGGERALRLATVACALKHRYGDEPLVLLSIDGEADDGRDRPPIDERLGEHGIATNTAIRTETVETDDVTAAVLRAAPEPNTDLLVTEWNPKGDGTTDRGTAEEAVARTPLPVYQFRLSRPPSELARLRLVIPRHVDHHEGFYEAVYNVKQLSAQLELPITVYVFERNVDHYRTLFDLVEIDVLAEFRSVRSWDELGSTLEARADPADLLVTLAVREDEIGWDAELSTVAERFADLPPRSLALCFLRADEPAYEDQFLRTN
ncbi:sodium:proton exchanger [Natronococcus sp.]|uniref:sodium:proton exchanger n=1 Tax=Natronococcus sp. TaxID=35747 RepID=UPI0025F614E5|nr:sodium:proton exchanger [Natronococcus sp.]